MIAAIIVAIGATQLAISTLRSLSLSSTNAMLPCTIPAGRTQRLKRVDVDHMAAVPLHERQSIPAQHRAQPAIARKRQGTSDIGANQEGMSGQTTEGRPDRRRLCGYPQLAGWLCERHVGEEHQHLTFHRPDMAERRAQAAPHPFGAGVGSNDHDAPPVYADCGLTPDKDDPAGA
jgi:hypothetical protein